MTARRSARSAGSTSCVLRAAAARSSACALTMAGCLLRNLGSLASTSLFSDARSLLIGSSCSLLYGMLMYSIATDSTRAALPALRCGLSSRAKKYWVWRSTPLDPAYRFMRVMAHTARNRGPRIPNATSAISTMGPVPSLPNIHCGSATPSFGACYPSGLPYFS